jgi:N-acetylneuraminic acid mutarotase
MPAARAETAVARLGNKVYVAGGFQEGWTSSTSFQVYDTDSDTWDSGPNLPVALNHAGGAAAAGQFYLVGGVDSPADTIWKGNSTVRRFNPSENSWSQEASLNVSAAAAGVVGVNGKVFAFGGADATGINHNSTQIYDPEKDEWSLGKPMPTVREHISVAVSGDMIFVIGGRVNHGSALAKVEAYSPENDSWETHEDMPTPRSDMACAALSDRIYCAGGEDIAGLSVTEEYNPATLTWRTVASLPSARLAFVGVPIDGKILAFGGIVGTAVDGTTLEFTPPDDISVSLSPRKTRSHPNPLGFRHSSPSYKIVTGRPLTRWTLGRLP